MAALNPEKELCCLQSSFPRMAVLRPDSELLPDGVAWLGSWLKTGKTWHSLACLVRGL